MNVYKFEIGKSSWRHCLCVLANNEDEACKIASKYENKEINKDFITKVYDLPQVVSVIREF